MPLDERTLALLACPLCKGGWFGCQQVKNSCVAAID